MQEQLLAAEDLAAASRPCIDPAFESMSNSKCSYCDFMNPPKLAQCRLCRPNMIGDDHYAIDKETGTSVASEREQENQMSTRGEEYPIELGSIIWQCSARAGGRTKDKTKASYERAFGKKAEKRALARGFDSMMDRYERDSTWRSRQQANGYNAHAIASLCEAGKQPAKHCPKSYEWVNQRKWKWRLVVENYNYKHNIDKPTPGGSIAINPSLHPNFNLMMAHKPANFSKLNPLLHQGSPCRLLRFPTNLDASSPRKIRQFSTKCNEIGRKLPTKHIQPPRATLVTSKEWASALNPSCQMIRRSQSHASLLSRNHAQYLSRMT